MVRPTAVAGFGCLLLIACGGCGSGTTAVEGVVLFDGQPLANASVQFIPQGPGRDATGATNEQGKFSMSTREPRDGVMTGSYKVVITPRPKVAPPQQFATAEEAMAASAAVRPQPAVPNFPVKYTLPDQTPLTQDVPAKGKIVFELKSN